MSEETHNNEDDQIEENSHWVPEPSPAYEKHPTTSKPINAKAEDKVVANPASVGEFPGERSTTKNIPEPITPSEERTWAMMAHFSVLLNLVTGFLGGIAAIIIYFTYKDRSRLVAYHAMQSFILQSITWLGSGLLAGFFISLGSIFAVFIFPLLCFIPGFLIMLLIPVSLIYGIVGGVKVNNGEDFRYWQIGDWVRDILEPKPIPSP